MVAGVPEPEPRRNPKTRIAGRVVDDQGEPVPNVTVRLAPVVAPGQQGHPGEDRSGGFTRRATTRSSTCWLIAEERGRQGPLTGKNSSPDRRHRRRDQPGRRRSGKFGDQQAIGSIDQGQAGLEEIDSPAEKTRPKVNREDLLPPAEDAGSIDPGPRLRNPAVLDSRSRSRPSAGEMGTPARRLVRDLRAKRSRRPHPRIRPGPGESPRRLHRRRMTMGRIRCRPPSDRTMPPTPTIEHPGRPTEL